ncbi:MAG: DNA ligase [Gammaproteobacteria bacterium]
MIRVIDFRLPSWSFMGELIKKLTSFSLVVILLVSSNFPVQAEPAPEILLAKIYQKNEDLEHYWVSEKLDGVRACWNGKDLISRQGNRFNAPAWFTKKFPKQKLDGELWIKRGTFEQLISTVKKHQPIDSEWQKVKYMIFDLPDSGKIFTDRLVELKLLINPLKLPQLQLIKQSRVTSHAELQTKLQSVIKQGAEGLMLHRDDSLYRAGRSSDLLKVKTFQDAEAIVIAHLPGKGKYKGMLGALLVEMPDGKRFKIGSGFKDKERKNPPEIGSWITYKYFGLSRKGIPKFASFLRIRK